MDSSKALEYKTISFSLNREKTGTPISLKLENVNNSLLILVKDKSIIGSNEFTASYSKNELSKLHKSFKMIETIEESIDFLASIIQGNKAKIYLSDNNLEFILELNIILGIKKEKIEIKLKKEKYP